MTHAILSLFVFMNIIVLAPCSSAFAARTPLTGGDLTYLGSFQMPRIVGNNEQTAYGNGLALRRVNGQVRLFSTSFKADKFPLFEVTVPTLKTSAPWNEAYVVKAWGDVLSDAQGIVNGLYWDETDKRLYYSSSWNYVASGNQYEPTLAFLTISPDETRTTSYGRWGFSNRGFKQVNFGLTSVPSDFATQYLGGKRLAAGFGGSQSAIAFGPGSLGPALTAFSPPIIGTQGGYLANTPLVGYGGSEGQWTTGSRPTISRAWRDDDQLLNVYGGLCGDPDNSTANDNPPWNLTGDESFCWQGYSTNGSSRVAYPDYVIFPENRILTKHWVPGNSFWTVDRLGQAGAWIQTANKEGFLLLPTFGTGYIYYESSEPKGEGFNHKWYIYSREQLASVAQGLVGEHDIQAARYIADFSSLGITSSAWSGAPPHVCTGMVFDPVDNKLYVSLFQASNAPSNNMYSVSLVNVYQINDTPVPNNTPVPNILHMTSK